MEIVLIPASADDPLTRTRRIFQKVSPHMIDHIPQRSGMRSQPRTMKGMPEIQQVHMGVVESGTDTAAFHINFLITGT